MTTGYWPQYRKDLGTLVCAIFYYFITLNDVFDSSGKLS